jgi:hypothetical protein
MSEAQLRAEIARATGVPEVAHPDSHAHVANPPAGYDPYWDAPLWNVPPIAKEMGKGVATVYGMIRRGALKGTVTKVAGQHVTTRRKLRNLINGV